MVILYNSNTGTTSMYAQALAEKIGATCVSYDKAKKIDADEEIVFMSWIMAGKLDKYAEVKEKFTNIKAVCAVGMLSDEKSAAQIKEKNELEGELFVLPGNFSMKKLKGMYKMMMNMMLKMIKSQTDSEDADKMKVLEMFENGVEFYNEEKLDGVVEFLND